MLILFAHLGLPPLWGSEGRWAVIARSMLRSGDLLSPVLGVRSYWDKPLLSYWQILPLSYINGDVSEFTARFPSVVWSVVMLLLTYRDDNRFFANLQSKGYHPQFRKKFRKDEVCVYSNGPSGDGGNQ